MYCETIDEEAYMPLCLHGKMLKTSSMKYFKRKNMNTPDWCRYKFNNWDVTGTAMRVNKTYAVVLDFDNHGETEQERKEIYENLCKRILPNPNAKEGTLERRL